MSFFLSVGVTITILTAASLCAPSLSSARHNAGQTCASGTCHSLDPDEGEPGTKYLHSSSRTMLLMKSNGWTGGQEVGCTYCHNTPALAAMKEALTHFDNSKLSKHPVGYDFAAGSDTLGEYLSSFNTSRPNELDCVDCHDMMVGSGGAYPEHGTPPADNPYLLKGNSPASDFTNGEYDDLCRLCHDSSAPVLVKGRNIQLLAHADAAPGRPIVEDDGTNLRVTDTGGRAQCTACHDIHYSGRVRLFNDGKDDGKYGRPDRQITGNDCTYCHWPADDRGYVDETDNTYMRHGHGKPRSTYKYAGGKVDFSGKYIGMGHGCTDSCHVSLDVADTSPSRKPHVENLTVNGDRVLYKANYNLSINLQDNAISAMGNPIRGVCNLCHAAWQAHVGVEGGGTEVGCQDCHDEHGEGSGPTSNVFMIPEESKKLGLFGVATTYFQGVKRAPDSTAPGEAVTYDSPRLNPATGAADTGNIDFYRTDGAGVCDQLECHGGPSGPGDLGTLLGSGGAHTGGLPPPNGTVNDAGAGQNCAACHSHRGDAGGWR